jgi:hypothetical protein
MKRLFKASKHASFNDDKAQVYGEYLWGLKEKNGDVLTPTDILKNAQSKQSPIHDYFQWDNSLAAKQYRLWQARHLMGLIEITVVYDNGEDTMRAFHNIRISQKNEETQQGYVTIKDLEENAGYLKYMLNKALNEIAEWELQYKQFIRLKEFKPLAGIINAIQKTKKDINYKDGRR